MDIVTPQSRVTTPHTGSVESWSVDSDLQGAGVPGQTRARSGVSTRGGTVTFLNDSGEPWKASALPGQSITIDAASDIGLPLSRIFTGQITALHASSALSPQITAIVKEIAPKKRALTLPYYTPEITGGDTARLIRDAASVLGWTTAPPTHSADFLHAPLCGHLAGNPGRLSPNSDGGRWITVDGQCALQLDAGSNLNYMFRPEPSDANWGTVSIRTKMLSGQKFDLAFNGVNMTVERVGDTLTFTTVRAGTPTSQSITISGTTGVLQINQRRNYLPSQGIDSVLTRIRWIADGTTPTNPTLGWSQITTMDGVPIPTDWLVIRGGATMPPMYWIVARDNYDLVYHQPTALIEASGIRMDYVLLDKQESAWEFLKSVTDQVMGATLITEAGELVFYSKDRLRGLGAASTEIIGTDTVADLPWSVDIEEVADRVEVAWTPAERTVTNSATQTVWVSETPTRITAKATVRIPVTLDKVAVGALDGFTQDTTGTATTGSRWIAFTTADGTSPLPAEDAIKVQIVWHTPASFTLAITNTTNGTLWVRDENGGGGLTLRAYDVTRPGEEQVYAIGASEETAENPYRHDGGTIIQSVEDAQNLAAWLHSTLSEPLPVLQGVEVDPHMGRKLGQIITIYDPSNTAIRSRALIYGVSNSQSGPAEQTQTLNLALLAFTIADKAKYFMNINPSMTINQRAQWLQANVGDLTLNQAAAWIEKNGVEVS